MAKPQSFKRIIVEDFDSKDRPLVSKLAYAINGFAEDMLNTLTRQITIDDNLNWKKKDVTIAVDVAGTPTTTTQISTDLDHACQGVLVIKCTDLVTAGRPPGSTPFISFTEKSGIISITNVTGLVGNNQYSLRVILF